MANIRSPADCLGLREGLFDGVAKTSFVLALCADAGVLSPFVARFPSVWLDRVRSFIESILCCLSASMRGASSGCVSKMYSSVLRPLEIGKLESWLSWQTWSSALRRFSLRSSRLLNWVSMHALLNGGGWVIPVCEKPLQIQTDVFQRGVAELGYVAWRDGVEETACVACVDYTISTIPYIGDDKR